METKPAEPKLGSRFRQLRKSSGLTQVELAAVMGYDSGSSMISQIENDVKLPSTEKLYAAARAMNIPLYLFFVEAEYTEAQLDLLFLFIQSLTGKKPARPELPEREPIGLALRYAVLKRDGFQCVACGASGREAQLEVDHIVPVSAGGNSEKENLQTLCFRCNHGKRDSV